MPRNTENWVSANETASGVMVYIPKGMLEELPLDENEPIEVSRSIPNDPDRNRVFLNLRNAED